MRHELKATLASQEWETTGRWGHLLPLHFGCDPGAAVHGRNEAPRFRTSVHLLRMRLRGCSRYFELRRSKPTVLDAGAQGLERLIAPPSEGALAPAASRADILIYPIGY